MKKCKEILIGVLLLSMVFFTACTSKAAKAMEKVELGQKYLTELNYTEAVASFTEAIGLDPENISAYMGRAEAYVGLKQYDDAKTDYTTAIEKAVEQPYTRAEAYVGRAEVNEVTNANEAAYLLFAARQAVQLHLQIHGRSPAAVRGLARDTGSLLHKLKRPPRT